MNQKGASLGLLVGIIAIAIIYQIIKWSLINFLGVLGVIISIVCIYYFEQRKKVGASLYWPITAFIM